MRWAKRKPQPFPSGTTFTLRDPRAGTESTFELLLGASKSSPFRVRCVKNTAPPQDLLGTGGRVRALYAMRPQRYKAGYALSSVYGRGPARRHGASQAAALGPAGRGGSCPRLVSAEGVLVELGGCIILMKFEVEPSVSNTRGGGGVADDD